MYFAVFPTILAAEYTAGLKMVGQKLARVPSMYFAAFPTILVAEYTAGTNDRDHSTSSSAFILYCQKRVGGMGEATKKSADPHLPRDEVTSRVKS